MVMIFESKWCMTWCPKRLQDEDHTYISRSMDKKDNDVIKMPCKNSAENNWICLNFQKIHELYVPMNQVARQSEVPTSRYGRITDGCTCWNSGQQAVLKWNNHSSLIGTPINTNEYPLER
jgi:hypothetical protein